MAKYDLLPVGNNTPKRKPTLEEFAQRYKLDLTPVDNSNGLFRRVVGDTAVSLGKGVVGTGEAVVGLADIASGGHAGKALADTTGYNPKRTKEFLESFYSQDQQRANQKVQEADGFFDTLKTSIENPSTILQTVVESAPSMLGGGAAAQGMGKLGLLARNPVARGAIGEGLVAGGQSAEQIRQENHDGLLTPKQSIAAGLSGITTGAIGFGGGKLAQKLGILDPQTVLAGGGKLPKGMDKHTFGNVIKGFVSEGALQELPQSATEQMWQNYAQDKPLLEGVPEAAATGLLAGGVMGAGANLLYRRGKQAKPAPKTTKELLRLGYDDKYKLGYEDLPTAPDVIYQGTDYQAPLQLPYEQPLRIGYEGLQPPPDVIYQGTDSPRLELPSPSQVEPYTPNSNPNLSNAYDPITEGLMRQADNYGMPEPKPTGTIGKALYAGGVTQQAINQPLAQGEITTPQADNLNSDNQSNGDNLPRRYPLNSRQKQVSIEQLKEIVKSRNGNVNTVELMEYTGSNHLQAARAINDVRHEINTLNREFDKFTEAKRAIKKLDPKLAYRPIKNPDTGKWRVSNEAQPLTEAELQNLRKQEAKKQRQLQRKRINPEKDSLLTAIIKLGGISTDWRLDTTADSKGNKNVAGVGYLWSDKTGASIDDVARRLADEGYIPASAMSNDEGVRWLQEAIKEELTLGTKHYALNSEKALEQQYEQALLDRLEHEQAIREDEYIAIREQYGIEAEQQARFYDEYATNYFQNLEEQLNELEQQATIIEGQAITQADSTVLNDQLREYDKRTNSEQTTTDQPTQETDRRQQEIIASESKAKAEQTKQKLIDKPDLKTEPAERQSKQLATTDKQKPTNSEVKEPTITDLDSLLINEKEAISSEEYKQSLDKTVEELFPELDYIQSIKNGKSLQIVSLVRALRDSIASIKPNHYYPTEWKKDILAKRKLANKILTGEIEPLLTKKNYSDNSLYMKYRFYEQLGHNKSLRKYHITSHTFTLEGKPDNKIKVLETNSRNLKAVSNGKYGYFETEQEAIDFIKQDLSTKKRPTKPKQTKQQQVFNEPSQLETISNDKELVNNNQSVTKEGVDIDNEVDNLSYDEIYALADEALNEVIAEKKVKPKKQRTSQPKTNRTRTNATSTPSKPRVKKDTSEEAIDRSLDQIAKDLGQNLTNAGKNIFKGLGELFGGKGKLSSGFTFDEETYAKAKPYFIEGYRLFKAAGKDLRDFFKSMFNNYGAEIKPYVTRFVIDVKERKIDVSDTSLPLERDSGSSEVIDTAIQQDVPNEPTGARTSPARTSEPVGERLPEQRIRDNQLSDTNAPIDGKISDSGVHSQDTTTRTNQPVTRDSEQGGVSSNGDLRQDVERARTTSIIEDSRTREQEALHAKQLKANQSVKTNFADKTNIQLALPVLFEPQQEDVYKAEKRFFKDDKQGILFTNGTGTGKTGTGSGIIRRFVNAGKDNIIVVVPNDKIARDWLAFLKTKLDVPAKQLDGITDNGKQGVIVTTYANFGSNDALSKREYDLIVADESHYLSQDEAGSTTTYLSKLRALSAHKRGGLAFARSYFDKDYKKYKDGLEQVRILQNEIRKKQEKTEQDQLEFEQLSKQAAKLHDEWRIKENEAKPIYKKRLKSKVVMLSATPFAYVKNVDYAEGYLFDYDLVHESDSLGYNSGDGRERFFIQHFGYRMRYNKLTRPDSNVDLSLMEREFHEWLKKEGAISGRRLDIPFDYDRKFFLTEDAVGTKLDRALEAIWEAKQEDISLVELPQFHKLFPYHERMYLLEAIKAKHSVDYINESLKRGRKVVVFHDYNKGGAANPYNVILRNIKDYAQRAKIEAILEQPEFRADFSDLVSPLRRFERDFDNALFINGTIPKAERERNVNLFNDDDSGNNLIIVQSDAGREGISLHDTTGNHQRVLINLGLPVRPVAASQEEGRIYRTGQASNAIFRYFTTGTGWETSAFTWKIAERAGTAENLALGNLARAIKQSFLDAYANAEEAEFLDTDGTGGKELDKQSVIVTSPFDRAKSFYYGQQKNTKRRDQREGIDYFATPEPVGFKMAEWADIELGNKVLEPSAGHGAIARFIPEGADATAIEPSYKLSSRVGISRAGTKIIQDRFENYSTVNKFDAIVMNPPYGTGGKDAMEHLAKAFKHLKRNGRIVALVPTGQFDKRFDKFLESKEAKDVNIKARILMPSVTFERAGTSVATQILVIDKIGLDEGSTYIDFRDIKNINELFDRIEHIDIKPRNKRVDEELALQESVRTDEDGNPLLVEYTTRKGKVLKGIIVDLPKSEAKKIDEYTFAKDGGFFIREQYLDENNNIIKPEPIPANEQEQQQIKTGEDGKPQLIEHTTSSGKIIKGIIVNMTRQEAKKIDRFTFAKNGGFFIREKHLDENLNIIGEQQYFRSNVDQASQAASIQSVVDKAIKDWKNAPSVQVVQTIDDLPQPIIDTLERDQVEDASGIHHNGKVYLIADNIQLGDNHALFVVEHEILGHYGLRGLFGNALNPILNTIYNSNRDVRTQANQLIKQQGYSKLLATEEALANIAASGNIQSMSFWSKLVAAFKNFGRRLGLPINWSDNDISYLLGNARAYVKAGKGNVNTDTKQQYSRASDFIDTGVSWLDNKLDKSQPLPDRLSVKQSKILKTKFAMYQNESIRDKAKEITSRITDKFIQGVFDSFAPLKALSEKGYMQAHLSKGTEGAVEAILHIGKPKLTDGALDVADDTGGLFAALAELNSNGKNELNEWLAWMSANRAAILKEQGRENLFTDDDIAELKKLNEGTMPDGRSRAKVYHSVRKQFNAYNKAVLDIAEQSGLIDAENRKTWESGYYLPFYRIAEDDTNFSIGQANKIVGQKAFHKLKGGTQALDDLLVNIVSNWSHLLTASMKNQAASASLKGAVKQGIADKLSRIAAGEYINKTSDKFQKGGQNVVWVMEDGKQKYYQVNDPLVFDALNMINHKGWNNPLINSMGKFKKALTIGVTSSPAFRVTSLMRDTLQAMAITDLDYNPINNLVNGFSLTKKGTESFNRLIASGAAIRFGAMYDGSQGNHLRNLMKELTIKDSQILDTQDKVKHFLFKGWDWYKELGDRGENINRAAIYERARAKGKDHLQGSFEARDLMNFTSSGKWAAVRFLAQTLPFFNARLQGLYKLGRGAYNDPKRFALVAGGVALASSLLYLLQKDDEDYKELPDWVRDNYWYIKLGKQSVYIPKPFEVGALGSVVERGLEFALSDNDYTAKDFAGTMISLLSDQLAMNPTPQVFKPAIEAAFNYDSFRGANIDTLGQQRLTPRDRYTANTTAGAIGLGNALNISPQRLEHLVRGYFGWLGTQVLNITDIATRPLTDLPSNPNRDLTKVNNYFLLGNFVRNTEIGAGSKYLTRFYDTQQEINQVYASLSNARKIGELEYAKELAGDNKLKLRRLYNNAKNSIDGLNKQIRAIRSDKGLSASEKNNRISLLQHQRNQLARLADQRARASGYL